MGKDEVSKVFHVQYLGLVDSGLERRQLVGLWEMKIFHGLQLIGTNDGLWDGMQGLVGEVWNGCNGRVFLYQELPGPNWAFQWQILTLCLMERNYYIKHF